MKRRARCAECRKKLPAVAIACRCGKVYCSRHRIKHACGYDYKAEQQKILAAQNPTVHFLKIKKI